MEEETVHENEIEITESQEVTPVAEIGELREEIIRLRTEIEDLRKTGRESNDGFSGDEMSPEQLLVKKEADGVGGIVQDMSDGRFRDAIENLLKMVNGENESEHVVRGGAIERESFMNAKGLEDLHGKVELAMELRRYGIPRADVVRMLRSSAPRPNPTRVEEPTARASRPVDENKVIEGYWKKALA